MAVTFYVFTFDSSVQYLSSIPTRTYGSSLMSAISRVLERVEKLQQAVKFAREDPAVDRLKELHASASRLIDETSLFLQRPAPPTQPAPPITASGEPPRLQPPSVTSEEVADNGVTEQSSQIVNRKS